MHPRNLFFSTPNAAIRRKMQVDDPARLGGSRKL
jgi:hypothetical protein